MTTPEMLVSTAPRLLALQPGATVTRGAPASLTPRVQRFVDDLGAPSVRRAGGAAVITIDGPLMSDPNWLFEGLPALAHAAVARTFDAVAADKTVATAVVELQCPGWGSHGSSDTLDALARLRAAKRTIAWVHDAAYSGGVWLACGCEEICATPTANLGHIGAIIYAVDASEAMARAGLKPVVVCDPERKGGGYPGVPYSAETTAALKRIVEQHAAEFFAAVASARGLTPEAVRAMNAAAFSAKDALAAGLVDRIETTEQFLTRVAALPARVTPSAAAPPVAANARKDTSMEYKDITLADLKAQRPDLVTGIAAEAGAAAEAKAEQDAAAALTAPATFTQLKALYGDDTAGIVKAQEGALTLAAARDAHVSALRARLAETEKKAGDLAARAADLEKRLGMKPGTDPVADGARAKSDNGSVGGKHPFLAACEALVAEKKAADLGAAMTIMARKEPGLHRDFIATAQRPAAR